MPKYSLYMGGYNNSKGARMASVEDRITRLNKREVRKYYSHIPKKENRFNNNNISNIDEYMPSKKEYSTVDRVTEDYLNGRGEFCA